MVKTPGAGPISPSACSRLAIGWMRRSMAATARTSALGSLFSLSSPKTASNGVFLIAPLIGATRNESIELKA